MKRGAIRILERSQRQLVMAPGLDSHGRMGPTAAAAVPYAFVRLTTERIVHP